MCLQCSFLLIFGEMYSYKMSVFFGKYYYYYYIFVVDFSPILPVDNIVAEEMHFPICNEVNFWGGGLFEM